MKLDSWHAFCLSSLERNLFGSGLRQKLNHKVMPMARNERLTCKELIQPRLVVLDWALQEPLRIGTGRVNFTGDAMSGESRSIIKSKTVRLIGLKSATKGL